MLSTLKDIKMYSFSVDQKILEEQKKYNEVDYCWQISDKYWNFVINANAIQRIETPLYHRLLLWLSARIKI